MILLCLSKMRPNCWPSLLYYLLLALSILNSKCLAKTVSGTASLTGTETEHTVAKFAASAGGQPKVEATFTTDRMYTDERSLRLYLFSDENWSKVKKASTCMEKARLARVQKNIAFSYSLKPPTSDTKKQQKKENWESRIEFIINQADITRPRYWYITIADCSLEMYQHDNDAPPIHYEMTIMNEFPLGSFTHLPSDEQGMQALHWYNAVLSALLALLLLSRVMTSVRTRGVVHFAAIIVLLPCIMSTLSSICEIFHLRVYRQNGIGSYTFDALSAHLEALCDASIALVLLAVAVGWTLPSDITLRMDKDGTGHSLIHILEGLRNPARAVRGKNPSGLLALCLIMTHSILAQWGRVYNEDFDCYHDLEHPPGRALFFIRLFLGFSFLLGVASLRRSTHCSQALRAFLTKFALVGVGWFMALPAMALVSSSTIPSYRRHQFVSSWAAIVQLCSLASLSWLFMADSSASAYHKVSKVSGSGDLIDMGGAVGVKDFTLKLGKTKIRMD